MMVPGPTVTWTVLRAWATLAWTFCPPIMIAPPADLSGDDQGLGQAGRLDVAGPGGACRTGQ